MLNQQYLEKIQELEKKMEPYALAVVVRKEAPSSGKLGDKAVINKFGEIFGWVGGGCVKAIMIKESEDAMKTGKARLIRIGEPGTEKKSGEVMEYKMTCQSEGTVEVFIEPILPAPHLVVMGKSAIAKALVKIGKAAGYRVTAVAQDARPDSFEKVDELITELKLDRVKTTTATSIVVVTQGEQDEIALEQAIKKPANYLGFVASQKKKSAVFSSLLDIGMDKDAISKIKSPAGIDINAKKPEEVAISILAEIILEQQKNPTGLSFTAFDENRQEAGKTKFYINPVCGVPIDIENPKHIVDYKGEKVYFCCDGCWVKFNQEPEKYMQKTMA
jgi:xanthine dehydrogenase accessory factor